MKQACMNCRFAQWRAELALFECRIKAPVHAAVDAFGRSKWPLVSDGDWCGEFQHEIKYPPVEQWPAPTGQVSGGIAQC